MSAAPSDRKVGFTSELGLAVTGGADSLRGTAPIQPELCVPECGVLRPSVLLTWADILIGSLANEHTLPRICMTVDLSVRIVEPIPAGVELESLGRLLKAGRTLTFGETTFTVGGVGRAGRGRARHVRGVAAAPGHVGVVRRAGRVRCRSVTSSRRPRRSRPCSAAASSAPVSSRCRAASASSTGPTPCRAARSPRAPRRRCSRSTVSLAPTELEIRYLGAVREGPMRATATRLGPWVRVEVIDTGNDDRPVAIAAARRG